MNHLFRLCIASIALPMAGLGAPESPVGVPHVYKKIDGRELKLYVSLPPEWKAADRLPGIVFFHGGGFVGGNAGQFAGHCAYLASRGMVAISAEYRLLSKARVDAPLVCNQDAVSAVRWVLEHAAELGIDPKRLALGGGSAGGHLAAYVGLVGDPGVQIDGPAAPINVAALVLFNPAIAWPEKPPMSPSHSDEFRNGAEEFLKYAPAKFVSRSSPPTLILSGELDNIVPMSFLAGFQARMKAAGVRCDAVFYKGQGHAFFNRNRDNGRYYRATLLEVDKFLGSLGWIQGSPTLEPVEGVATIDGAVEVAR